MLQDSNDDVSIFSMIRILVMLRPWRAEEHRPAACDLPHGSHPPLPPLGAEPKGAPRGLPPLML
jgi:hypothetical protein